MEIQQTPIVLLARNVNTLISSQNKFKTPTSNFNTNINHISYNKQLVWNRVLTNIVGKRPTKDCFGASWITVR
jgi:hypothetical protein